jgi:type IV pilus assembly protein PilW
VLISNAMQNDPNGCVAQGIENMQLEFGFDGNGDGAPDYYTDYSGATPPPIGTLTNIIAVRVHLLARSTDASADPTYRNKKTYQLAGVTVGPLNDKYYRRSISSVVLLRNQAYRLNPYALSQ